MFLSKNSFLVFSSFVSSFLIFSSDSFKYFRKISVSSRTVFEIDTASSLLSLRTFLTSEIPLKFLVID